MVQVWHWGCNHWHSSSSRDCPQEVAQYRLCLVWSLIIPIWMFPSTNQKKRFGPAHRVIALSKLTVQLARYIEASQPIMGKFSTQAGYWLKVRFSDWLETQVSWETWRVQERKPRFTRAHMFGPGTKCRCANCTEFPKSCCWGEGTWSSNSTETFFHWGKGIYAGTLLLYAQDIAMNQLWTQVQRPANQGQQLKIKFDSTWLEWGMDVSCLKFVILSHIVIYLAGVWWTNIHHLGRKYYWRWETHLFGEQKCKKSK